MNGAAKDDPDSRQADALLDAIDRASEPRLPDVERATDSSGRSAARYASKAPHAPPAARSGPAVVEPAVIVESTPAAPWSAPRGAYGIPAPLPDGQTVLVDRSKLVRPAVANASNREKLLAFVTMVFVVSACGIGLLLVSSRRARRHVVVPAPVVAAASTAAVAEPLPVASPAAPAPAPSPVRAEPPAAAERGAVTASGLLGASAPEPAAPAAPPPRRAPRAAPAPTPAAPPPPSNDGELKSHFER